MALMHTRPGHVSDSLLPARARCPIVARQRRAVPAEVEAAIKKRLLRRGLVYSAHARERVEHREVTEEQVLEVLQQGAINKAASQFGGAVSPVYCLERRVGPPGQPRRLLRVVVAQGEEATVVVTCTWKEAPPALAGAAAANG